MTSVEATTGARLHFGLLCRDKGSAWHYGGVGMMVSSPGWRVRVSVAQADEVVTANGEVDEAAARADSVVKQCRAFLPELAPLRVELLESSPLHSGLGAGTQLALAVASAARLLAGNPQGDSTTALAQRLNRVRRSAIGTAGFERGGFLVDHGQPVRAGDRLSRQEADAPAEPPRANHDLRGGSAGASPSQFGGDGSAGASPSRVRSGKSTAEVTGQRVRRLPFPDEWRMVLLTPVASSGVSGDSEEAVFRKSRTMADDVIAAQIELIEARLIPSIVAVDFATFRDALEAYGTAVGEYFTDEQGGVFSSPLIRGAVSWLTERGVCAPVQSSWGPTVCIPAESAGSARAVCELLASWHAADAIHVRVAKPLNTGATIRMTAPERPDQRVFG